MRLASAAQWQLYFAFLWVSFKIEKHGNGYPAVLNILGPLKRFWEKRLWMLHIFCAWNSHISICCRTYTNWKGLFPARICLCSKFQLLRSCNHIQISCAPESRSNRKQKLFRPTLYVYSHQTFFCTERNTVILKWCNTVNSRSHANIIWCP